MVMNPATPCSERTKRLSPKGGNFRDPFEDLLGKIDNLSDEDLERALSGGAAARPRETIQETEPGTRLRGVVVDVRGGEVLIEIAGKDLGVIDEMEFTEEELPRAGETIDAEFTHYDRKKEAAVLTVKGVRTEVAWDSLRVGALLEGVVADKNKGGLTLDIKGIRAFMPISQVERERIDDLTPYIGKKLQCMVTSFDRNSENLVVSRREILDQAAAAERERAIASLQEGDAFTGTVARVTDHGAFINLGTVDGLLHASKIHQHFKGKDVLNVGQKVRVQVIRIDRERQRIGLDFKEVQTDTWGQAADDYAVGDEVTGWVSSRNDKGLVISVDEGVDGLIPHELLPAGQPEPTSGDIVKAIVTEIDPIHRRMILKPSDF
jgi:small subunit ribosomal protein S1